jgi:hypothetical protein
LVHSPNKQSHPPPAHPCPLSAVPCRSPLLTHASSSEQRCHPLLASPPVSTLRAPPELRAAEHLAMVTRRQGLAAVVDELLLHTKRERDRGGEQRRASPAITAGGPSPPAGPLLLRKLPWSLSRARPRPDLDGLTKQAEVEDPMRRHGDRSIHPEQEGEGAGPTRACPRAPRGHNNVGSLTRGAPNHTYTGWDHDHIFSAPFICCLQGLKNRTQNRSPPV